jgi:hypothetical protein
LCFEFIPESLQQQIVEWERMALGNASSHSLFWVKGDAILDFGFWILDCVDKLQSKI